MAIISSLCAYILVTNIKHSFSVYLNVRADVHLSICPAELFFCDSLLKTDERPTKFEQEDETTRIAPSCALMRALTAENHSFSADIHDGYVPIDRALC